MGIAVYPQPVAAGGGIKSVQRGSAAGAGTVSITAVDINKSFVTVFGTASSGNVSASFGLNSTNLALVGNSTTQGSGNAFYYPTGATYLATGGGGTNTSNQAAWQVDRAINAAGVNAGSNNLVAAIVQGYLSGSTSLVVSGACRWEVVEFN